jgi:hypothetical protein
MESRCIRSSESLAGASGRPSGTAAVSWRNRHPGFHPGLLSSAPSGRLPGALDSNAADVRLGASGDRFGSSTLLTNYENL